MSPPEVLLWVRLRQLRGEGPTFRRQHPIGPYIADFYCASARLVVEVDGAGHTVDAQIAHDARRDAYFRDRLSGGARAGCRRDARSGRSRAGARGGGARQALCLALTLPCAPSVRPLRGLPPPPFRSAHGGGGRGQGGGMRIFSVNG